MMLYLIEDQHNAHHGIAFDTKEAAEHYVAVNNVAVSGMAYQITPVSVYSLELARVLWPQS